MGNHYWNAVNGREFQLPLGASSVPLGKRGALLPPLLSLQRQAAKPPFHGWEGITRIRNDSARCRRTKTHSGGNRPTGCPSCSRGYYLGLMLSSLQDAMDFFLFLSNLVQLNLTLFFFFFFLIRVLFICLVFDRLSFSCSIFLFKYFRYHTRVKKREHRVDQLYSIFIEIDGMVGEEEFLISLLFFFKNSNFNYISKV